VLEKAVSFLKKVIIREGGTVPVTTVIAILGGNNDETNQGN
jgi:pyruvate/2-oxoglutarate dehydrogenase complex dihydrolipoamide acyltransferase (E2) component